MRTKAPICHSARSQSDAGRPSCDGKSRLGGRGTRFDCEVLRYAQDDREED